MSCNKLSLTNCSVQTLSPTFLHKTQRSPFEQKGAISSSQETIQATERANVKNVAIDRLLCYFHCRVLLRDLAMGNKP